MSSDAMQDAREFVAVKRRRKEIKVEDDDLKRKEQALEKELLLHMEEERISTSFKQDGATVFLRTEVWAGPVDGNHQDLAERLAELGMVELLPKTVNSQSLSGFIREQLDEDETLPLEERLHTINPRLLEVVSVTEKNLVRANGL